jgi:hypothetical protein
VDPFQSGDWTTFRAAGTATAIFHTLKACGYQNTKRIGLKNHAHKMALITFLKAVNNFFAETIESALIHDLEIQVKKTDAGREVAISYCLKVPGLEDKRFFPVPPLNFQAKVNDVAPDFGRQIDLFVRGTVRDTSRTIENFLEAQTRTREQLLYAPNSGLHHFTIDVDRFHTESAKKVFRNLTLFLLIDQHHGRQEFVQLCVDAFVKMISSNKKIAASAAAEEASSRTARPGG